MDSTDTGNLLQIVPSTDLRSFSKRKVGFWLTIVSGHSPLQACAKRLVSILPRFAPRYWPGSTRISPKQHVLSRTHSREYCVPRTRVGGSSSFPPARSCTLSLGRET